MLCLIFFAFTTILGWDYYSERCLEYLCHGNQKVVHVYRWIYILAVLIGPFMTISAVWTIADIFNGLMALPNLVALIALSGVIVAETKSFDSPAICRAHLPRSSRKKALQSLRCGKCSANLGRLHYRLLTICFFCWYHII